MGKIGYECITTVTEEGVLQEMKLVGLDDKKEVLFRQLCRVSDLHVRNALIALGWTPPPTMRRLKDGEPCSHPGCLSHASHPCEGCGRVEGKSGSAAAVKNAMEWLTEPEPDNGTAGALPVDEIIALVAGLVEEAENLRVDRDWQIKQNVKRFTALQAIEQHLKLSCDKRDDGVLAEMVDAAMIEAGD